MNTPETINIEKYAHALNELIGIDSAYLCDSDENVNAIIEVIVAAKKLEKRVKELEKEKSDLEYTLIGVMHSVDKWLDGAELEMDEVNRAITMREKTLQIVENLTEKWEEAVNQTNYSADVTKADIVHKMQKKLDKYFVEHNEVKYGGGLIHKVINEVVEELTEGEV